MFSRISILYVPKHEQNFHKIPTILKTFCKNKQNIFFYISRNITHLKIPEDLNGKDREQKRISNVNQGP